MSNDIAEMMRETLIRVDAAEAAHTDGTPDWARIDRLINHPGRPSPRRRRITMLAAALAVLLVAGGVISGVPHRLFADQSAAKYQGPVLGPELSRAWQQDLRQRAVSEKLIGTDDTGTDDTGPVAPPAASSIDVLFARDVGPYRLALVRGTWSVQRGDGDRTPGAEGVRVLQRWFVGPAGAAADQLQNGAVTTGERRFTAQVVQPGAAKASTPAMRATGVAVVVVPSGSADVRLAGPAGYSAAGKASLPRGPSLPSADRGIYVAGIPADGAHRLIVDGSSDLVSGLVLPVRQITMPGSSTAQPTIVMDGTVTDLSRSVAATVIPPLNTTAAQRGGPVPPRAVLDTAARLVFARSGLRVAGTTLNLVSALPYYSAAGQVTEWSVLITATAPSGARFAGVSQVLADGTMRYSHDLAAWVLARRGSLDDLALAWPSNGITEKTVRPGSLIQFIGPRKATLAMIIGKQGQVVLMVPVKGGLTPDGGTVHTGMKKVRFLDAAGQQLVEVPVGPYAGGTIPLPMDSWPDQPVSKK